MSNIPDIREVAMPFEEKVSWVSGSVAILVAAVYASVIVPQLSGGQVGAIAYQAPMLIAIAAMIVVTIVGTILMSIGTAVTAEITGTGSVDEIGRTDERDHDINRRGELVGYYVSSVGVLAALALAMLKADHFWIANAIFLGFMVSSVVGSAYKILIYRRGF
jgi:hypothetical protein